MKRYTHSNQTKVVGHFPTNMSRLISFLKVYRNRHYTCLHNHLIVSQNDFFIRTIGHHLATINLEKRAPHHLQYIEGDFASCAIVHSPVL